MKTQHEYQQKELTLLRRNVMILIMTTPLFSNLLRKKDIAHMVSESHAEGETTLKRHLTATNLVLLGIGAVIGAGIFSLTGVAAANYAGPAIVYSFIIGGILCAFAGLCYAEMAAMVPVAGSAYAYSYATLGELIAWIIGWDLILEYAFGAITVASSWSGYLTSLVTKTLGIHLPDTLMMFTKGPWEMVTLADGSQVTGYWNVPAMVIPLVVGYILYKGIRESAKFNNLIVAVKVTIIIAFILLGWSVIDYSNWAANPDAAGLLSLIPQQGPAMRHGEEILSYGFPGVLTGAGVVFFAYIGFDAVSTTAQEAIEPQRSLPIGILGSLVVCTLLYILVALTLTGVVHYTELGVPDPIAVGVDKIVSLRGWSIEAQKIFSFFVKLGALAGLTSVILVLCLGQTRIFYSMAKDKLLPWFDQVHPKYNTPHVATAVTAVFVSLLAGCMPMSLVGELVSIGTLLAFVLVCLGVVLLRIKQPHLPRPFKTPVYWLVGPAGAAACLWVMTGLPHDTWLRLFVWLIIGFVIYFTYSKKHSKIQNESKP